MRHKKSYIVDGDEVKTKECILWRHMLQRCEAGGKEQAKHPTYIGCSTSETFKDFQFFAEWCQSQVGFGLSGYHLDKDILFEGNKVYSEDICVFIPQELNKFLTTRTASRGDYPLGVSWHERSGKFRARVNITGKVKHLGIFSTPEAAHDAYIIAKEAEAYRWYERLRDGEFAVDPRVIERMRTWRVNDEQ